MLLLYELCKKNHFLLFLGSSFHSLSPHVPNELRVSTSEHPDDDSRAAFLTSTDRSASTSGTSEASDQTVIHLTDYDRNSTSSTDPYKTVLLNPRLAMISSTRNDSYMRATHDSMSESMVASAAAGGGSGGLSIFHIPNSLSSPTLHGRNNSDSIMIENDDHSIQVVSISYFLM